MHKIPFETNKVKIGHWYSCCCVLDLYQIKTDTDLTEIRNILQQAIDDPLEDIGMMTWPTLIEAINYFRTIGDNVDEDLTNRPDLKTALNE